MIETRLLLQFIAVAEELHFSRAAKRLHMAQPPLSQAIRKLENEIGASLFERTNRSVALTSAGSSFLVMARRIVQSMEEGVAHTRRVALGVDGHLTMTFINILPYPSVLRALRTFRQSSGGVAITMQEATTQEQILSLERGTADIGFMRTPGATTPDLHIETVLRERLCVALPIGHPLAEQPAIVLTSLKDEAFLASPRPLGPGFYDQLIKLCQAAGFVPTVVQHARQLQTLITLVASGFGIALIPETLGSNSCEGVVFRRIEQPSAPDELLNVDLLMAWNPSRNSPVRDRLIEEVRKIARED